jgi:hypothetical protein
MNSLENVLLQVTPDWLPYFILMLCGRIESVLCLHVSSGQVASVSFAVDVLHEHCA